MHACNIIFHNAGKHFRIGVLENKKVVVVMCGLGMVSMLFILFLYKLWLYFSFCLLNLLVCFCVAKCRYYNPIVAYFI